MRRVLGVLCLWGAAGCSIDTVRTVELASCWSDRDFENRSVVRGEGVALYNPDGPLLIQNKCHGAQFVAYFDDGNLERRILNSMRSSSLGQWYGGQAYEVSFVGLTGNRSSYSDGTDLVVSSLEIKGRAPNP